MFSESRDITEEAMPKTIIKRLFNEVLLFPIISDYKLNFLSELLCK